MELQRLLLIIFNYVLEFQLVSLQYNYGCTDLIDSYTCFNWKLNGMCQSPFYRNLAESHCQKTCELCYTWPESSGKACKDRRKTCPKWIKHCQQNSVHYEFMTENCRRTCLFCEDKDCADKNERCEVYSDRGYCNVDHRYHAWMKKNCEMTCRFCLAPENQETQVKKQIKNLKKHFFCDFEKDECDWSNQHFEDTADWSVGYHVYGPQKGFNSSKYLYLGATVYEDYYANLLLPWQLILPEDQMNKGKMCFHFVYQMNGGKISVSQKATPTLKKKYPQPTVKFTTLEKSLNWKYVKIDVDVSDGYELIVKGVKGVVDSYLAIDYVFFTEGRCF